MTNRLADAISPYLRSHADNPVDWFQWGEEAFAEATKRDVPVLVSIGYSTCHWCHVMARESFSDPELAAELNSRFVSIKVDREEHPDVDAGYLAAASAFTQNLGWPLTVFTTPGGRVFFAGTYFPPVPRRGLSSFRQVLEAVDEAWTHRREDVEQTAAMVADALAMAAPHSTAELPGGDRLGETVSQLAAREDRLFGGFGAAPKFPIAPVLTFMLNHADGAPTAVRALEKMAVSPLRDAVDGGFFRYAVQRDWSEPHYERMLYDNAQLLRLYAGIPRQREVAAGLARFLLTTMRVDSGAFASAQDSESTIDGERVEGVYYSLSATERADFAPPARDTKVLTGWNGLAIGALAHSGFVLDEPDWVRAAAQAADALLAAHRREDGTLARASVDGRISEATATLEDYGMLAGGLIELALVTGQHRYAVTARELVDATIAAGTVGVRTGADAEASGADAAAPVDTGVEPGSGVASPFGVPGGADPVLAGRGLAITVDPSEGAYPSGLSATASAARMLYVLTGVDRYADVAGDAMRLVAAPAMASPLSFGAALRVMDELDRVPRQLILVSPDAGATPDGGAVSGDDAVSGAEAGENPLAALTRDAALFATVASVTDAQAEEFARAGFELFQARTSIGGEPTAYYCREFVCRLPTTDASELAAQLEDVTV